MPQFFTDESLEKGAIVELRGKDARHISLSLRLNPGDEISLSDAHGNTFQSKIETVAATRVVLRVSNKIERRKMLAPPWVALSVIKQDRFEWAIQKLVELGICRIIPLVTARTVRHGRDSSANKAERWRRIAVEAAKQSGLPVIPNVEPASSFDDVLTARKSFDAMVVPHECESALDVRGYFKGLSRLANKGDLLLIGPEGGFTPDEIAKATNAGAVSVSLGQQILRAETAAVVVAALWQYELGNLGL